MLEQRSVVPAQGRLRRNAGAYPTPTIWVETDINTQTANPSDAAFSEVWLWPGVYPFMNLDTRRSYNSAGVPSFSYQSVAPTPDQFADMVENRYDVYHATFAEVFRRAGKPFRYGIRIAGPDTRVGDSPLLISRDPDDLSTRYQRRGVSRPRRSNGRRNRPQMTRVRMARPGAQGLDTNVPTGMFHVAGRERVRAWAISAFAAAKARLEERELPVPEVLVSDIETWQVEERSSYAPYKYISPEYTGAFQANWFADAARDYTSRLCYFNYEMDAGSTFAQWMAARPTTLAGSPIPEYNGHYYINNPKNDDVYRRMRAALQSSFRRSYQYTIFEPAKLAFGADLRCASWGMFCDSRASPIEPRPTQLAHWNQGEYGDDFQINVTYPVGAENDDRSSHDTGDPRWNIAENWVPRLLLADIASSPVLPHIWVLESRSAVDRASAKASDVPLMMCTAVTNLNNESDFSLGRVPLVERMRRGMDIGCRMFWMFTDKFGIAAGAAERKHLEMVVGDCLRIPNSWLPRRNQMRRRSGVPRPRASP